MLTHSDVMGVGVVVLLIIVAPFPGSMFSALVLVFGCLLQRRPVTTEGHHGTNRYIFYAVQMDRGVRGARALAQQHGLEFIQRVSAFLSPCRLSLSIF